jgi:phage shock protein PspC (stress-responsive transcriptional regulator)
VNCQVHPDREAVAGCISCGNLVCADCDVLVAGKHHCKPCLASAAPAAYPAAPTQIPALARQQPRLVRSSTDCVLGGVCSGVARYIGIDPALVRIMTAIAFLTGVSILFYVVAWIVIPLDRN